MSSMESAYRAGMLRVTQVFRKKDRRGRDSDTSESKLFACLAGVETVFDSIERRDQMLEPCVPGTRAHLALGMVGIRIASMSVHEPDQNPTTVLDRETQRVEPPPIFQVMILNDDYTPMEFVVTVLQQFFSKDADQAFQIMWKVHIEGKGVCGVYPRDIAATKVDQVIEFSRQHQHPLQCVMEEA